MIKYLFTETHFYDTKMYIFHAYIKSFLSLPQKYSFLYQQKIQLTFYERNSTWTVNHVKGENKSIRTIPVKNKIWFLKSCFTKKRNLYSNSLFSQNMNFNFRTLKKTFQMWKRENMSLKICHLKIINGFLSVINLSFFLLQPPRLQ